MKPGDFLDLGGSKSINIGRNRRVLGALTKPWIADTLLYPSLKGKDDTQSITRLSILKVVTYIPANTKHLYNIYTMLDQSQRRWADVVSMLYKMFCVCWDGGQVDRTTRYDYRDISHKQLKQNVNVVLIVLWKMFRCHSQNQLIFICWSVKFTYETMMFVLSSNWWIVRSMIWMIHINHADIWDYFVYDAHMKLIEIWLTVDT